MTQRDSFRLKVWSEYACFTRPEMKAERVSYDVITPSAARNIFQAILWKPAIDWQIYQIDVIKPIRWTSMRRNELGSVIPDSKVETGMKRADTRALSVFIEDDRLQRSTLMLRDVQYILHGRFDLTARAGKGDDETKFREQFKRRAQKGQCAWQPYMGCREFTAFFELLSDSERSPVPIDETRDLGWMLFDMDYRNRPPTPCFFSARLESGTMRIPAPDSSEVKR